jgi:hypothetical protein
MYGGYVVVRIAEVLGFAEDRVRHGGWRKGRREFISGVAGEADVLVQQSDVEPDSSTRIESALGRGFAVVGGSEAAVDVIVDDADVLHERVDASAARLGDADRIARAFSTVAWIFARLRMIERSCTSRSTSRSVIAATRTMSKPWKALRNASRLPNTIDQLSPASNTPRVSASSRADSS